MQGLHMPVGRAARETGSRPSHFFSDSRFSSLS
jgi:hypothetical protein